MGIGGGKRRCWAWTMPLVHKPWLKAFNNMGHIRLRKKVRLKEILILKENHISGCTRLVSNSIITNKTFVSISIPHKSTACRLSNKFVTFSGWKMDKTNTPKSMKGLILRMITKRVEIRRVILPGLHRQTINQVDNSRQGFNPKFRWNRGFN